MPKFTISEAADMIGVSVDTLRRWEREGKITSERTEGGHRRYDLSNIIGKAKEGTTILYARVSTRPQKKDLERQILVLESYAKNQGWNYITIKDLGSGVNYNKKGLHKLLTMISSGEVCRLVLTNKDRLLRFGSELVFSLCDIYGVEVVILNRTPDETPEEELVKDVLEIITVFAAKLHGLRSHQNVKLLQENLQKLVDIEAEN
jgi:putative resolvase